ncbi:hypothetical protein [Pseudomonas lundensis]|uniref:hypothetical protein n=1 Tax=Pseudomonas lundensis TaxID=86185 RepID=UPI002016827D|nr:hypothetical protein [Pseudomonas lundensis]
MNEDRYEHTPRAGDHAKAADCEMLFLAPKPVPTGFTPFSIQKINRHTSDVFIDVGPGVRNFEFEFRLAAGFLVSVALIFTILNVIISLGAYAQGHDFRRVLIDNVNNAYVLGGAGFLLIAVGMFLYKWVKRDMTHPCMRFNRQRREVAYASKHGQPPFIVPWEEVVAGVTFSRTVNEHIKVTASLMIGLHDRASGALEWMSIPRDNLKLAISEWEALRVYMEEGQLRGMRDTLLTDEACTPGTVAHFHQCRRVYRDTHSALAYCFGFLMVQWCSGWTLPCRLAQWLKTRPKATFPKSIVEWSTSLPPKHHAKPSAELLQKSAQMREAYGKGINVLGYFNIEVPDRV